MTNERRVLVHPDKQNLGASVAARFITKIIDVIEEQDYASVVLSGGSVSTLVLAAINRSEARDSVDWSKVSFWWADERFVADGDDERNDKQNGIDLLDHIGVLPENVHRMANTSQAASLAEAATQYQAELKAHAQGDDESPRFDITLLGVGPDGHVASLFPDKPQVLQTSPTVLTIDDSPKPPPERLTLSLPAINNSQRVWLILAGAEKAASLGLALAGAGEDQVPVAGVKGRKRTVFFVDKDAAAEVPEQLIASTY
ncbi:6-phosphogluconolactonase [Frondihabitans australicus]|uniref:6-phosphogluconolactonase n=1 Tax=Frondihabitans australicus TaxID=386892 RepID=A0A495IDU2_9MICO|nr:6-phosphogluconolactonase [Frondihabitans australicus]RKR74152.1 6-phosphogluconolactonase [Frondihabitans australicus]